MLSHKQNSKSELLENQLSINKNKTSFSDSCKKEKKEEKIRTLSNYLSTDKNLEFLKKNKYALKDYQKFLSFQQKSKEGKAIINPNDIFLNHYNKEKYRDNPRLIISCYNTEIIGIDNIDNKNQKKSKFKVNILGVDEGLIKLSNKDNNEFNKILLSQFSSYGNNNSNNNSKSNENIKNNIITSAQKKINNNSFDQNNNNTNVKRTLYQDYFKNNSKTPKTRKYKINITKNSNINYYKSFSAKKSKITEQPMAQEIISNIGIIPDESPKNNKKAKYLKTEFNSSYHLRKLKEKFEDQLKYNYEIKKLNNWDFEHVKNKKQKLTDKQLNIILNKAQSSQMKWYINIKNDKKQLQIMMRNKYLHNFFNKIDKEQKAIYIQTMNVNKKGFNFDIFSENNNQDIKSQEKIDNMEQISQIDFYRDVMREKLKVEEMFNLELANSAEQVYNIRVKKQETMIELYEISEQISELLLEKQDIKTKYKNEIKILNMRIDIIKSMPINTNNNSNNIKVSRNNSKKYSCKILGDEQSYINNNINYNPRKSNKKTTFYLKDRSSILSNNFFDNNDNNSVPMNKDEKFIQQSLLITQKTELEMIYRQQMRVINAKKDILDSKHKKIKQKISEYNIMLKKYKSNLDLHIQTLSGYYYQILKKGIDVRSKGLCWVIVKLMELNAHVDKHYFPQFLDDDQISFILRVGIKIYELSELLKLFQILKDKQKLLKEKHIEEDIENENKKEMNKLNELENNHKTEKKIGKYYVKYLEELQMKYDKVINYSMNEKREEQNINRIARSLKEQMLQFENEDDCKLLNSPELYFIPGSLALFFAKDKRFRQYFDDVYYLKEEISKRQKDIEDEKEKALKLYKYKLDLNENKEKVSSKKTSSIENEMVYAALFGNGIAI